MPWPPPRRQTHPARLTVPATIYSWHGSPAAPNGTPSVEEYLKLEQTASIKHEYVAGEIHAMVGASRRHNMIAGKIYRRLADAAEGGLCRVYISDMKQRVADDIFYYPDVMVACRTPRTSPVSSWR